MSKKEKIVRIPKEVIQKIHDDFEGKNLKVRIFNDVPLEYVESGLVHPEVAEKSAGLMLTVSGNNIENRDYMVVSPLRIDHNKDCYVTDLDPIVMVYNNKEGAPEPTGVIRFHGKFEGRTEPIDFKISYSVKEILSNSNYQEFDFEHAPHRYQNATHYMANIYRMVEVNNE
jgi:hypothetical protein